MRLTNKASRFFISVFQHKLQLDHCLVRNDFTPLA